MSNEETTNILQKPTSRRSFLRWTGMAAAAGTVAACGRTTAATTISTLPPKDAPTAAAAAATSAPTHDSMSGAASPGTESTTVPNQSKSYEEMDKHHEEGVKKFPAKTEGIGNQPFEPKLDGDVKVFDISCDKVMWEVEPGRTLEAWVYNKQLPGPVIRVTEGDKVKINVTNNLDESTAVHWHGLFVPNNMDGVPFITQPPIIPGSTFTYEFTVREGNAGSHMYHSHHNSAKQTGMGLLGAFIIEPKDKAKDPAYDIDYVMILNDAAHGFTLNGKGFPATEPIVAKKGQKVRIRYMNEGLMIHPMHLHGMPQLVFAKDGWNLPQPFMCDTLNVAPGERWDVIVDANEVGLWAFHCHILSHAESEMGMFGMVTVFIVQE